MFGNRRPQTVRDLSTKNILGVIARTANGARKVRGHVPDREVIEDLERLFDVLRERYDLKGPAADDDEDEADAGAWAEEDVHDEEDEEGILLEIDETPDGSALRGARNWLGIGLEVVADTIEMSRTGYQNIESGRSASKRTLADYIVPFYLDERITFYEGQEDPAIQVIGRNIPEGMQILLIEQPEAPDLRD